MPLGIKAWRGRKQDWVEEKWGWGTVTRAQPTPWELWSWSGPSELSWVGARGLDSIPPTSACLWMQAHLGEERDLCWGSSFWSRAILIGSANSWLSLASFLAAGISSLVLTGNLGSTGQHLPHGVSHLTPLSLSFQNCKVEKLVHLISKSISNFTIF